MSFHAMGWAARQTGLSPTHKLVLIMLAERADRDTDVAFPSYATMAEDCGLSRRACINAIRWLAENGYISAETREKNGRHSSNAYRMHCGKPANLGAKSSGERGALVNDVHHKTKPCGERGAPGGERGALPGSERGAPEQVSSKPIREPSTPEHAPEPSALGVAQPFEVPDRSAEQDRFPDFWAAYPRKENRTKAEAEFISAAIRVDAATIIRAAHAFGRSVEGQEVRFLPLPATWLRDQRWTDQIATAADPEREARRKRWARIARDYGDPAA